MKTVRVTYTAKPEFAETNQKNIRQVMDDLRAIGNPGINYTVLLSPDNKTFTHTTYFASEADEQVLLTLPAFQTFQQELRAAGFEAPPKSEHPTLVGSSVDVL